MAEEPHEPDEPHEPREPHEPHEPHGPHEPREHADDRRSGRARTPASDPVGRVFGWRFGPFGAAFGSVVDANRIAFGFAFGTGRGDVDRDDRRSGLENAATIEIDDGSAAESGDDVDGRDISR